MRLTPEDLAKVIQATEIVDNGLVVLRIKAGVLEHVGKIPQRPEGEGVGARVIRNG